MTVRYQSLEKGTSTTLTLGSPAKSTSSETSPVTIRPREAGKRRGTRARTPLVARAKDVRPKASLASA